MVTSVAMDVSAFRRWSATYAFTQMTDDISLTGPAYWAHVFEERASFCPVSPGCLHGQTQH